MRISSSVIIATLALGLTACNEHPATKTAVPNLAEATSAKAAEATQARVVQAALPKADKATPLESYMTLDSGNQIMFSYLALAGMPVDYADIASRYSQDYTRTSDEFRKNDLLTALKPRIDTEVKKAAGQRYFKLSIDNPIEKYDFERKGFPLNSTVWEAGSYRYFYDNAQYKLGFTNGESMRYLAGIPEDVARKIETMRSTYKSMNLTVYCFVQDADTTKNTVKAEIVKVVLTDKSGNVLASQGT